MKKSLYSILILLLVSLMCFVLFACNKKEPTTEVAVAFSSEGLFDNPDRGFRGELYLTLGRYGTWPGDETVTSPTDALDAEIEAYPEDIHIIQQYVYLTDFYDKDLSDEALEQLTTYFEYARQKNVKFLLRFAYEYDTAIKTGPTTERILSHIAQLKGWLNENSQLFKDVIYSVQLGMIGVWGEGHSSSTNIKLSEVMTAMADFIPEPYTIMLRYYTQYKKIPEGLEDRFAFHEDWLVGQEKHVYDFYRFFDADKKEEVTNWCRYTLNDAEMPWGSDTTVPSYNAIDILKELYANSITTLSIKHNYIEHRGENPGDYFLNKCKDIYLTKQDIENAGLPFRAELLNDGKISVFDYLSYHLGYMLSVDKLSTTGDVTEFKMTNYGFAAPVYYKIQLLDLDGNIMEERDIGWLCSGASESITVSSTSPIRVRIVHKANDAYTIKLANDVPYENGVNILRD